MSNPKPVKDLTYEESFTELEAIVALLETGEQPLDKALDVFSRGRELVKHCAKLLEKAELKVRQIDGDSFKDMENPA